MAFMKGWKYCNVKVPLNMAWLDTDDDVSDMLKAFVGGFDMWFDASTGYSPDGPYEEGDINYLLDGRWRTLSYDFMVVDGKARVFRYCVD